MGVTPIKTAQAYGQCRVEQPGSVGVIRLKQNGEPGVSVQDEIDDQREK